MTLTFRTTVLLIELINKRVRLGRVRDQGDQKYVHIALKRGFDVILEQGKEWYSFFN